DVDPPDVREQQQHVLDRGVLQLDVDPFPAPAASGADLRARPGGEHPGRRKARDLVAAEADDLAARRRAVVAGIMLELGLALLRTFGLRRATAAREQRVLVPRLLG